jgi:GT2 family glycosyltransferase
MTSRVTAVVLNWCNEKDTTACIESLERSDHEPLTVLLVDNGSPDGSGDRLHERFPGVPYLQTGGNFGYAGGNNRGIAWALAHDAEFVLLVNDDAVVDAACVSALVRAAEDTGAAAVGPQIRYFDDPSLVGCGEGYFSRVRALGIHHDYHDSPARREHRSPVTFLSGCCVLIRASALRELGAFDESYFAYLEDAELSLRYLRAGQRLVYEPAARVLHRAVPGATPSPFQIRQRERNRRRLVTRHYGLGERTLFMLWFYPTRLVHLGRYVLQRDWTRAAAIWQGTWGALA